MKKGKEHKTEMSKAQKTVIGVETAAAVAMFVVVMLMVKAIVDGSIWAVVLATLPALAMALLLEDADRIRFGAKGHNSEEEE